MDIKSLKVGQSCPVCHPNIIGIIDIVNGIFKCSKSGLHPYYANHLAASIGNPGTSIRTPSGTIPMTFGIVPAVMPKKAKFVPPNKSIIKQTIDEIIVTHYPGYNGIATISKPISDFPNTCPRCGGKCYIGLMNTQHEDELRDSSCR